MAVKEKGKMIEPVGTCSGSKDVRCSCGGQLAIGGVAWQTLPVGFGFAPGSTKFQIDTVKIYYYEGFCFKCKKQGYFKRTDKKPTTATKYPKLKGKKVAA